MDIVDAILNNYYPSPDTGVNEAPNAIQRSLEDQITTFQLMSPSNATFEETLVAVSAVKLPLGSAFVNSIVFESIPPEGRHGTLGPNSTRVTIGKGQVEIDRLEAAISLTLNESLTPKQNLDTIRKIDVTSM